MVMSIKKALEQAPMREANMLAFIAITKVLAKLPKMPEAIEAIEGLSWLEAVLGIGYDEVWDKIDKAFYKALG